MILKNLSVRNFRNIASADFEFHPEVNIFTGNNAQGKTNLCEAVSVCLGKSFRKTKYLEFAPFGKDSGMETSIELVFSFDNLSKDNTIRFVQKDGENKLTFNDIEMKSAEKLYGALRYVSFIPDDLYIVKGSPEGRRGYLDYVSNMINRVHNFKVYEYVKALRQKNNLLAKLDSYGRSVSYDLAESWDDTLAKLGVNVMCGRLKYFEFLSQYAKKYYSEISHNDEILSVKYLSSVMEDIPYNFDDIELMYKTYRRRLRESFEKSLDCKHTTVGVHRDDILFMVNDMPAREYASQGQLRSIAISLKLAEAKMIYEKSGDFPIIILDDILSELDEYRRGFIINHIDKLQTFITSCNISDIKNLSSGKIWNVKNGKFEVC